MPTDRLVTGLATVSGTRVLCRGVLEAACAESEIAFGEDKDEGST